MTDATTDTTDTATTGEAPGDSTTADPAATTVIEGKGTNAEAAKYRTQLRTAEGKVTALAAVVAGYQSKDVQALAEAAGLASGADLFTSGVNIGDLLDEAGNVDEEKVKEAVGAVLTSHPHWRSTRTSAGIDLGPRSLGERDKGVTWDRAFKDALRQ
jgi:hypothetical protein